MDMRTSFDGGDDRHTYVGYPLVTDIENLASSCFLKIAALFAKLQRLRA
jgi:hypothetical protein